MSKDRYTQVDIQYKDGTLATLWVNTNEAIKNNSIFDYDADKGGIITNVYSAVQLTKEEIVEQRHRHLEHRKGTDI